jgi:tRNA(Ile)-lysidine synthase
VLDYLAALKQPFREDATNADPHYTRNRIRHELLPLLRTFNPEIVTALSRLADHAAEAHDIISERAADVLTRAERPRVGCTVVLGFGEPGFSPAVVRAVLRLIWQREGWPAGEMNAEAWDRAVAVARGAVAACDFPGGIAMRHTGRMVRIGPRE